MKDTYNDDAITTNDSPPSMYFESEHVSYLKIIPTGEGPHEFKLCELPSCSKKKETLVSRTRQSSGLIRKLSKMYSETSLSASSVVRFIASDTTQPISSLYENKPIAQNSFFSEESRSVNVETTSALWLPKPKGKIKTYCTALLRQGEKSKISPAFVLGSPKNDQRKCISFKEALPDEQHRQLCRTNSNESFITAADEYRAANKLFTDDNKYNEGLCTKSEKIKYRQKIDEDNKPSQRSAIRLENILSPSSPDKKPNKENDCFVLKSGGSMYSAKLYCKYMSNIQCEHNKVQSETYSVGSDDSDKFYETLLQCKNRKQSDQIPPSNSLSEKQYSQYNIKEKKTPMTKILLPTEEHEKYKVSPTKASISPHLAKTPTCSPRYICYTERRGLSLEKLPVAQSLRRKRIRNGDDISKNVSPCLDNTLRSSNKVNGSQTANTRKSSPTHRTAIQYISPPPSKSSIVTRFPKSNAASAKILGTPRSVTMSTGSQPNVKNAKGPEKVVDTRRQMASTERKQTKTDDSKKKEDALEQISAKGMLLKNKIPSPRTTQQTQSVNCSPQRISRLNKDLIKTKRPMNETTEFAETSYSAKIKTKNNGSKDVSTKSSEKGIPRSNTIDKKQAINYEATAKSRRLFPRSISCSSERQSHLRKTSIENGKRCSPRLATAVKECIHKESSTSSWKENTNSVTKKITGLASITNINKPNCLKQVNPSFERECMYNSKAAITESGCNNVTSPKTMGHENTKVTEIDSEELPVRLNGAEVTTDTVDIIDETDNTKYDRATPIVSITNDFNSTLHRQTDTKNENTMTENHPYSKRPDRKMVSHQSPSHLPQEIRMVRSKNEDDHYDNHFCNKDSQYFTKNRPYDDVVTEISPGKRQARQEKEGPCVLNNEELMQKTKVHFGKIITTESSLPLSTVPIDNSIPLKRSGFVSKIPVRLRSTKNTNVEGNRSNINPVSSVIISKRNEDQSDKQSNITNECSDKASVRPSKKKLAWHRINKTTIKNDLSFEKDHKTESQLNKYRRQKEIQKKYTREANMLMAEARSKKQKCVAVNDSKNDEDLLKKQPPEVLNSENLMHQAVHPTFKSINEINYSITQDMEMIQPVTNLRETTQPYYNVPNVFTPSKRNRNPENSKEYKNGSEYKSLKPSIDNISKKNLSSALKSDDNYFQKPLLDSELCSNLCDEITNQKSDVKQDTPKGEKRTCRSETKENVSKDDEIDHMLGNDLAHRQRQVSSDKKISPRYINHHNEMNSSALCEIEEKHNKRERKGTFSKRSPRLNVIKSPMKFGVRITSPPNHKDIRRGDCVLSLQKGDEHSPINNRSPAKTSIQDPQSFKSQNPPSEHVTSFSETEPDRGRKNLKSLIDALRGPSTYMKQIKPPPTGKAPLLLTEKRSGMKCKRAQVLGNSTHNAKQTSTSLDCTRSQSVKMLLKRDKYRSKYHRRNISISNHFPGTIKSKSNVDNEVLNKPPNQRHRARRNFDRKSHLNTTYDDVFPGWRFGNENEDDHRENSKPPDHELPPDVPRISTDSYLVQTSTSVDTLDDVASMLDTHFDQDQQDHFASVDLKSLENTSIGRRMMSSYKRTKVDVSLPEANEEKSKPVAVGSVTPSNNDRRDSPPLNGFNDDVPFWKRKKRRAFQSLDTRGPSSFRNSSITRSLRNLVREKNHCEEDQNDSICKTRSDLLNQEELQNIVNVNIGLKKKLLRRQSSTMKSKRDSETDSENSSHLEKSQSSC